MAAELVAKAMRAAEASSQPRPSPRLIDGNVSTGQHSNSAAAPWRKRANAQRNRQTPSKIAVR